MKKKICIQKLGVRVDRMNEKIYNKLVRDNIPEIIEKDGEIPFIKILNETEFKVELERKLLEEYHEVLNASNREERLEELADMLEIITTLSFIENSNLETVLSIMEEKREKKGGFSKKIFLQKTIKK